MGTYRTYSFLPQRRIVPALFFCILLAALASGCSSRVGTDAIRSGLSSGNIATLEEKLEETHEAYGEFVTACNLARIHQIAGRWQDSIKAFDDALVILEDYENRAVINVRGVASGIGTALFSRGADEYYGTGYERSLLHTFNSLNYLMLGDFSGAAVEMRRMDKRQEIWLEESQAKIDKYLETEKRLESPEDLPIGYSMRDILGDAEVRGMVSNYQDAFSYMLAALIYRLDDDMQSAQISFGRAAALDDGIAALVGSVWPEKGTARAKNGGSPSPEMPRLPRTPEMPTPAVNGKIEPQTQEVAVIAFSGIAPALRVESVRAWLPPIGYILIDLPAYSSPVSGVAPEVSASRDDWGETLRLYPFLRTDKLAYRTLWDEVRMEATFAFTRALTRAGVSAATYAAARSSRETREYAALLATLATVLMDAFSSATSESVRNWETLPNTGYLGMAVVPRGSTVTVCAGGAKTSIDLPLDARGVIIMATGFSNTTGKVNYVTY